MVPKALIALLIAAFTLAACSTPTPPPPDALQPTETTRQMLPLQKSGGAQPETSPLPSPESESDANADVQFVRAKQTASGTWTFSVTVLHPDTGWDDYADGWDVVLPDGSVVKPDADSPFTRLLLHPHVDEQPFTRSQSGIVIPEGVEQVTVRAHDLVDGWGGKVAVVDLSQESGPDFEVVR
ncbi:MAG TPA: hypothetical protein G4N94_07100 [Caldilineae bacterium]|nr:hypothetical protein [Caldilineae bacterium]